MPLHKKLVQPINTYFMIFLALGILGLVAITLTFYIQGESIQKTVQIQSQRQAEAEFVTIFNKSMVQLNAELQSMSDWDEVHQQFQDPSYYFFWHRERLIDSPFFKKNYQQIELYNKNKVLLIPVNTDNRHESHLPLKIESLIPSVTFNSKGDGHLTIFNPVKDRKTDSVIGYVGVSLKLLPYIITNNNFMYTDQSTIQFIGEGKAPLSEILHYITFKPVTNPVTDYLWNLIQVFLMQLTLLLFMSSIFITVVFRKFFSKPVEILSQYLQSLKDNPNKSVASPSDIFYMEEFETIKRTLHDYHKDLHAAQKSLSEQNQKVWEQARRDSLTNIYNRRAFDESWNTVLETSASHPEATAFILFDCDYFKALNDTYGHEVGDEVIRISAVTLQTSLPIDCSAFRIGGDEFAVIIQKHRLEKVLEITSTCLKALQTYNFNSIGIKEQISFSVGIGYADPMVSTDFINDIISLPKQADIAMYRAKESLQHKIQCYDPAFEHGAKSLVSSNLVSLIMLAIQKGDNIVMHYQPIQGVDSDQLYFESLVRIQGADDFIFPNDIFSVVQRRRLEVEMDTQIIRQVLKALQNGEIPDNTGVAINVSGKTLLQSHFVSLFTDFIPYIKRFKIVIEVTENTLIDHMDYAQSVLNKLRTQGFLIALDDFGSGYSSIRYLAHMPVDIVKFDMSMTLALNADSKTINIIQSTAEMVRRSGYDLVLEGIEDEDLFNKSVAVGATHLQGYLLGKPNPVATAPKYSTPA